MSVSVKTGDVWLAALDPTVGSEIQKTRPCVIVSPPESSAACCGQSARAAAATTMATLSSTAAAVIEALDSLNLHYPKVSKEKLKELAAAKQTLVGSKK